MLSNIYKKDVHIAVWKRELSNSLKKEVASFIRANPLFRTSVVVTPNSALEALHQSLGDESSVLGDDIAELVDIFCKLFKIEEAKIKLSVLDHAMCPKFHVDRLPCRLITTYQGIATDWLPGEKVDRSKLGPGSKGKPDHESGLFENTQDIKRLNYGDVALLKGDLWEGNEGKGLVHRSPTPENQER